jgi:hypothetical protein
MRVLREWMIFKARSIPHVSLIHSIENLWLKANFFQRKTSTNGRIHHWEKLRLLSLVKVSGLQSELW